MTTRPVNVLLVLLALVASAVGVVYSKHMGRELFIELQVLANERDRMDVEWGQLQLQQSTLTTQGQVELVQRCQCRRSESRAIAARRRTGDTYTGSGVYLSQTSQVACREAWSCRSDQGVQDLLIPLPDGRGQDVAWTNTASGVFHDRGQNCPNPRIRHEFG